ncbi:MAG: hypothetical protein JSS09_05650, partial [Verrucomicrobia bacterium]|nr:hypothetical protein [Verrucomicrobiota bacterium]
IKIGKKELYETQKSLELKKRASSVIGIADLENPQFLFLEPLKNLSSLAQYPPFVAPYKDTLLETCLNFQIYSLHQLIEKSSLRFKETFLESKPYYFYAIYEVEPEAGAILEEIMAKSAACAKKENNWCFWKTLLGGDCPKYVFCTSFATKEQMKEWTMENVVEESRLKSILRGKKTGWMKRHKEFCFP